MTHFKPHNSNKKQRPSHKRFNDRPGWSAERAIEKSFITIQTTQLRNMKGEKGNSPLSYRYRRDQARQQ